MFTRVRTGTTALHSVLLSAKRVFSHGRPRIGRKPPQIHNGSPTVPAGRLGRASTYQSKGHDGDAAHSASSSATVSLTAPRNPRIVGPSYLYRSFMGHSTRFAAMNPPLTRADITRLEREPLAHMAPGRVNDHICIAMVKMLRWVADRAFRERYIHRATMLVTVAAAAPAAGSVAAYLRMFFKCRPTYAEGSASVRKRTSVAADADSPFLAANRDRHRIASPAASFGHTSCWTSRLYHSTPNSPVSGAPLRHSYVDELRGLLVQSECHAVHYQILGSMAEISAVERGLVPLLQAFHFVVYLVLFLVYPRMGFRLMAYTAEESSVVWTQMVNDIDLGKIAELRVPKLAMHYWGLEGVFTAQGALLPMVVAPKTEDVVRFNGDGKSGNTANAESSVRGVREPAAEKVATKAGDTAKSASNSSSPLENVGAEKPVAPAAYTKQGITAASEEKRDAEDEKGNFNHTRVVADPSLMVFTLRDAVLLIRSDEMVFRDLNHEMANELDTQSGFLRRLADRYLER